MKKVFLTLASVTLATAPVVAQKAAVDEAEKLAKANKIEAYDEAKATIAPALENAETKDDARTWYVAGKGGFTYYDNMQAQKALQKQVDNTKMANAIVDGYQYFLKAYALDSIPEVEKDGSLKIDKKTGAVKFKSKYRKDIISTVASHMNDFQNAGSVCYEQKDFAGAYKAWNAYGEVRKFAGSKAPAVADTIVGQIMFFKGIAAWQDKKQADAVKAFDEALALGYNKEDVYKYSMACYAQIQDNAGVVKMAKLALPLYGSKNPQYLSIVASDLINDKKYDEAMKLADDAIAQNAQNADAYNTKAYIYEQQGDADNAQAFYKKSVEVNPQYAEGYFNLGRLIYNKGVKIVEAADPKMAQAAYSKMMEQEVKPLYKEALPYLQKAVELNPQHRGALDALDKVKYGLGME